MAARRKSLEQPRYRVLDRIGAGGMAEVFLGEHLAARVVNGGERERVVLKRVLPHLQDDPEMVGMLRDEIRLGLACFHPNLVGTLDSWEHDGQLYAVLEYVDGLDLTATAAGLLECEQRFTRGEAVHICMELCQALRHMHELTEGGAPLSVVHRDVTPPNVLLAADGSVKLCDFGFAKSRMQRTLTAPGMIKGKFSYLSPEAANGDEVDARADLFAIGIMLWEMLTMQRLFDAPTDYETVLLVQRAEVPRLAPLTVDCDDVLQDIISRALARRPQDRFQDAQALYNALAAYMDWQELHCDVGDLVERARSAQTGERRVRGNRPGHRPSELLHTDDIW